MCLHGPKKGKMMKQQLLYGIGDLRFEDTPKPEVGPKDMLIAVKACAVCPTDVRKFKTGDHGVPYWPFNMGHEWAGDVVEVGDEVQGFRVGMRIAGGPWGGYAEYLKISTEASEEGLKHTDTLAELPDGVSYEEGTFMEPFADCIHSVDQAQVRLGDTLVVMGSGQMGLQHTIVGKLQGLKVIVCDLLDNRLELAKEVGADFVVNVESEDVVARVKELTNGKGADGVCVTVGSPQAMVQSLEMVKKTGSVVLFSGFVRGTTVTFDPNLIHYGEVCLVGSEWVGLKALDIGLFRKALELMATGRAPVKQLITHRFSLEDLPKAIEGVHSKEILKAIIQIQ
jgi:L-iditol 2-dehydrogenase